jgi:lysozyme
MVLVRWRRRWSTTIGLIVLALALAVLAGYWFYEPGWRYEVRGVEVSEEQGDIDWLVLANDRTDFVYIRATEGRAEVDPEFEGNWEQAQRVGLTVGAYHSFALCEPGGLQAGNFIRVVPVTPETLPPAVALDSGDTCTDAPTPGTLRAELQVFIRSMERRFGTPVVISATPDVFAEYLADDPPEAMWWVTSPVLEPWGDPEWTFWQHFRGRRSGVEGRIARIAFEGTRLQFDRLVQP